MAFDPHIREVLNTIPAYVPGEPAPADAFKVSSNESPFAPLPQIRDALIKELDGLNRYPDMSARVLRERLGALHEVSPRHIHVSTGASAILADIVRALVGDGEEVIYPWRSFESYPIVIPTHGATPVPVPLTPTHEHGLPAMAAAVNPRTRLIIVCSPNNPTGTVVSTRALADFLSSIPRHIPVVIDEAYVEFAQPGAAADTALLALEYPSLVRVRTFSKVHGLAGVRLGYAIAHPRIVEALAKVSIPFGASSLAQAAACAALDEDAARELRARTAHIRSERARVLEAVSGLTLGFSIPASHGNFIYVPAGEHTDRFVAFARERGLIIRGYGSDGARISIGEDAANTRTIEVLTQWSERYGPRESLALR